MPTDLLYDTGTYDGIGESSLDLTYDGLPIPVIFTPPLVRDVPPFLPETRGPTLGLFRHYAPRTRGVNVFALSDGTFVQDTATTENDDTNIPYPWNPSDPSGPYSRVINFDGSVTDTAQTPYITQVWYGGHSYVIDDATANALAAAGYEDCLT